MLKIILDFIFLPTLYRLAGSDAEIPRRKALRRYGIPAYLYLTNVPLLTMNWSVLACCLILGLVCSFDLDEIEDRRWDDVCTWGFALAWPFAILGGFWSLVIAVWWFVGVYWSNIGIFGLGSHRLKWKWVEIGVGVAMAITLTLGGVVT